MRAQWWIFVVLSMAYVCTAHARSAPTPPVTPQAAPPTSSTTPVGSTPAAAPKSAPSATLPPPVGTTPPTPPPPPTIPQNSVTITIAGPHIPPSPYGDPKKICPTGNLPYFVGQYPGSPFVVQPFTEVLSANPPSAQRTSFTCRADNHCMAEYEITVKDVQLRAFDTTVPGCQSQPATWFLTYNGLVPGPTFHTTVGHETLVRFTNAISTTHFAASTPCVGSRSGRPISIHNHGGPTLAPFDGWADDEVCFGESKDYLYAQIKAVTDWYHDHAVHITAENAYSGMAGFFLISDKVKDGGCGSPWNLEDIEDRHLVFADKLIDRQCQLFIDPVANKDNMFGDLNFVSGKFFPRMPVDPKYYRFRMLNAAVSRPFLISIKNTALQEISQNICLLIAKDGGYRPTPAAFPGGGLIMGVGEREEMVCDFTNLSGQTLYLWNGVDPVRMKDVPMFCYSHLLARIEVSSIPVSGAPVFQPTLNPDTSMVPLERVLSSADIQAGLQLANKDKPHRVMAFGRSNGRWTINGETWDSFKIAASDVGQNTWEVWKFSTGGGWFHPIHLHLVDFFLLRREGSVGLFPHELNTPMDIFHLGPSETVWALIRFGPHKGSYMFHCHNLQHEDDDMMRAYSVVNASLGPNPQSAQSYITINNIVYANFKYADPMFAETSAKPTNTLPSLAARASDWLSGNLYRIFFPLPTDPAAIQGPNNPWKVNWCSPIT